MCTVFNGVEGECSVDSTHCGLCTGACTQWRKKYTGECTLHTVVHR